MGTLNDQNWIDMPYKMLFQSETLVALLDTNRITVLPGYFQAKDKQVDISYWGKYSISVTRVKSQYMPYI